ncbi:MAG: choice-of-anchor D domain-containing protein, partial [Verrucomicrobia bacterium]|nr:choice-of-anchor D domain-containing protein [Verrucomicrobiota bacterium]MBU1735334.1 choice-of-anchor D domain-containing protein [Verrucomicrobiota bacterium]MBU1855485.1 choice-of-anchor D domain-containing protein [Verrucomicrobiota bacterium]
MKRILAIFGLFAITAGLAPAPPISYDLIPSSNGPAAGGNTLIITNYSDVFGSDITNVVFSNSTQVVSSTNIPAKDTKWVCVIVPAHAAGEVDIVVQSSDAAEKTLSAHPYTYNPAGYIGTEWGETAGLPTNLYGLAAGTLSGEVYAVGGYETVSGNNAASNVYHYVGTNWVETVGLPQGRRNIAVGVCSGLLYAVGGAYGVPAMSNVYVFNGSSWTEVASVPLSRSAMGVGVLSGAVYAVGGYNGGSKTNVYKFDGSAWTQVAGLPSARDTMGCGVLNDRLYIVGGFTNTTGPTSDGVTNVFMFNGSTWTEVQGLPEKRGGLTACVLGGRLYAIGGYGSTYTNSVFRFDGTNWDSVAGLPAGRSRLASTVFGDQMLVIGGLDGSGHTNVYYYPSGGVSPTFGSITGGYVVTISGENLGNGSDITNVSLCGISTTNFTSQSATQIVIVAAAGAPRLGDVRVYSINYGETVKSNGFTYSGPVMSILGTNGVAIASGEVASAGKGTDFGTFTLGTVAVTHTFAITNGGNQTLTISGMATNGSPLFQCSGIPGSIAQGTASNFSIVFNPNVVGIATASVVIVNNSASTPYVVNLHGVVESIPTPNGWLAIQVTPALGTWQLTAPVGYTGQTAGTGNLAAVSAVTGAYGIAYGALAGYVAPSNQSQFVTGGSTTLFAGVYLQISTNIATPSGVSATEGIYTNRIRVTWQGVAGATGYEIWRSRTN